MLKEVHDHITSELNQSARTDTIFVITAIVFNLIVLGINSGIAGSASSPYNDSRSSDDILLVVFTILLLSGMIEMYKDNGVDKYYDISLLGNYNVRYTLFTAVILCLGLTAIIVPLVIRWVN